MRLISDVIYELPIGGRLKLDAEVLKQMLKYVQDEQHKTEGGGVILGRFIAETDDIVIDLVTEPMAGDKRSRTRFKRGVKNHQAIIDKYWYISNGTINYLGEWHTHPEPSPNPSFIDVRSWKKMLSRDKFDSQHLYYIIIGTREIGVWEGNRDTLKFTQLKEIKPKNTNG
jgi:integrative and conjugative element protein (TIGR02256 family)